MSVRSIYALNAALLLAFFAAAVAAWDTIPDKVPMHFDFAGSPTRWVNRSYFAWFGLPILAVITNLLLYGASVLAVRTPELWNVPDKKRFLALAPEARAPVVELLHRSLAWTATAVTVVFIAVQIGMYESATGRASGLSWYVQAAIWGPLIAVIAAAVALNTRIRKLILEAEQSSPEPVPETK